MCSLVKTPIGLMFFPRIIHSRKYIFPVFYVVHSWSQERKSQKSTFLDSSARRYIFFPDSPIPFRQQRDTGKDVLRSTRYGGMLHLLWTVGKSFRFWMISRLPHQPWLTRSVWEWLCDLKRKSAVPAEKTKRERTRRRQWADARAWSEKHRRFGEKRQASGQHSSITCTKIICDSGDSRFLLPQRTGKLVAIMRFTNEPGLTW